MKDKPIAYVLGLAAMVGCCVGLPLLIASSSAAGLFAWLTDNVLLGVLLLAAGRCRHSVPSRPQATARRARAQRGGDASPAIAMTEAAAARDRRRPANFDSAAARRMATRLVGGAFGHRARGAR